MTEATPSVLTARALADMTGLHERDLDLKPGQTRAGLGGVTVAKDAAGLVTIEGTDPNKSKATLRALPVAGGFEIQSADISLRGTLTPLHTPEDHKVVGAALATLRRDAKQPLEAALFAAVNSGGQRKSAQEWLHEKRVEDFHANKDKPMAFKAPAHMKSATVREAAQYHLQGFKPETTKDGLTAFSYSTQTQNPEKLTITLNPDGTAKSVTLQAGGVTHNLPPTRETQRTVVEAALEARQASRPGDLRGNPTITSVLHEKLGNDLRGYNLGRSGVDYIHALAKPVGAAPTPSTAAAFGAAKSIPPKGRGGFAMIEALATLAVVAGAAAYGMYQHTHKPPEAQEVDMSKLEPKKATPKPAIQTTPRKVSAPRPQ